MSFVKGFIAGIIFWQISVYFVWKVLKRDVDSTTYYATYIPYKLYTIFNSIKKRIEQFVLGRKYELYQLCVDSLSNHGKKTLVLDYIIIPKNMVSNFYNYKDNNKYYIKKINSVVIGKDALKQYEVYKGGNFHKDESIKDFLKKDS